jgi:hypothetical protein
MVCPQCGESSQVLRLKDYWRSLSQDAEAKRDLAQPPDYAARWLIPACLVALAVFVLSNGDMLGLLLLAAGGLSGWWMRRQSAAAQEAQEAWERALYCRRCPAQFEPGGA